LIGRILNGVSLTGSFSLLLRPERIFYCEHAATTAKSWRLLFQWTGVNGFYS